METTLINIRKRSTHQVRFDCWFKSKHIHTIISIESQFIQEQLFKYVLDDITKLLLLPDEYIQNKFQDLILTTNYDLCEDLIFNSYHHGLGVVYSFFMDNKNFWCTNLTKIFYPNSDKNDTIASFHLDFDNKAINMFCPFFSKQIYKK